MRSNAARLNFYFHCRKPSHVVKIMIQKILILQILEKVTMFDSLRNKQQTRNKYFLLLYDLFPNGGYYSRTDDLNEKSCRLHKEKY